MNPKRLEQELHSPMDCSRGIAPNETKLSDGGCRRKDVERKEKPTASLCSLERVVRPGGVKMTVAPPLPSGRPSWRW
jgi:hypothetical protein